MVGKYIVRAAYPASGGNVLPFRQQKLGVGYPAVTRKAGVTSLPLSVFCGLGSVHISTSTMRAKKTKAKKIISSLS